jgi:hypothetical protein
MSFNKTKFHVLTEVKFDQPAVVYAESDAIAQEKALDEVRTEIENMLRMQFKGNKVNLEIKSIFAETIEDKMRSLSVKRHFVESDRKMRNQFV